MSRYQGKITIDGWRKVKAAGYKGIMLKTVSTNHKLSKRAGSAETDIFIVTRQNNALTFYSVHRGSFVLQ